MTEHSLHSSYREKLIEHLLVGELLKFSWRTKGFNLEISKPEVDRSGYDMIVEVNDVVRHVQLKTTFYGSKIASCKIHVSLSTKPSGCVVLVCFSEESLELGPFYYFGSEPGEPLPSIEGLKVAKHTKANSYGVKTDRPNIRVLNKGDFVKIENIGDLYQKLFGVV